ncbi:uncharacterized protein LOC117318063 [Pecten maximus]|uniref:uncharacterized protein LOC117318063 n=1 Tax=Pecten maximus TaxID=6579 RepID=UPI00145808FA|nr:uncharacterized protein LOC117318063 [Pecten maximus]
MSAWRTPNPIKQGVTRRQEPDNPPGLTGDCNVVDLFIDSLPAKALLDTGATVSSVSQGFYEKNLSHIPLQPIREGSLDIQVAGGARLPYLGYIEVTLQIDRVRREDESRCLLLVVPDYDFNQMVPVLLGTNVLTHFMERCREWYGERYLQHAPLTTPWYTSFRCISLREKKLERNGYCPAVARSAESSNIVIPPNGRIDIQCKLDREVYYPDVCALMQPTSSSVIPDDMDIAPTILTYPTIMPVRVQHPLHGVVPEDRKEEFPDNYLDRVTFNVELDDGLLRRGKEVLSYFPDVFSAGDLDLGHTIEFPHRIELSDPTPFKQRHRRIPPAMVQEVREHLQQLLACGVIRRSCSPWASGVVLARKKNGSLRMCIDYRQLNQRTIKDAYALPRIEEIHDSLSGSSFFSVLDMKSGYHQVEVA